MWRLMVSARDPGAAATLGAVLAAMAGDRRFQVAVVAAGPAARDFRERGIAHREAPLDDASIQGFARAIMAELNPDAVLTGLSGQGRGIDEALVAAAGARPTYALQDYPGDVNPGYGRLAATFLVTDEESARLTRVEAPGCRVVVVGNVKFGAVAAWVDPPALRRAARTQLGVAPGRKVVAFYGQPIGIPGYWRSLEAFATALRAQVPDALVLARPHPKEDPAMRARTLGILGEGLDMVVDSLAIEPSVAAADLACTCFSTSVNVLNYLNRMSPEPLGGGLYLMMDPEVAAWFRANNRPAKPPLFELAVEAERYGDLPAMVERGLSRAEAERSWRLTCDTLPHPGDAAGRVIRTIAADLQGGAACSP